MMNRNGESRNETSDVFKVLYRGESEEGHSGRQSTDKGGCELWMGLPGSLAKEQKWSPPDHGKPRTHTREES